MSTKKSKICCSVQFGQITWISPSNPWLILKISDTKTLIPINYSNHILINISISIIPENMLPPTFQIKNFPSISIATCKMENDHMKCKRHHSEIIESIKEVIVYQKKQKNTFIFHLFRINFHQNKATNHHIYGLHMNSNNESKMMFPLLWQNDWMFPYPHIFISVLLLKIDMSENSYRNIFHHLMYNIEISFCDERRKDNGERRMGEKWVMMDYFFGDLGIIFHVSHIRGKQSSVKGIFKGY